MRKPPIEIENAFNAARSELDAFIDTFSGKDRVQQLVKYTVDEVFTALAEALAKEYSEGNLLFDYNAFMARLER